MTTRRNRPISITDAPEHRSISLERVEIRAGDSGDPNELVLEGYASTYEEYEMYGGPANWGWIERIDPKAFDITLREKPDLHFLINHAGMPLARTKSGNLDLAADDTGLKVIARLDTRDPDVKALQYKMERGDMDEMSFAFRVKGQEWRAADGFEEDEESYRTITEVSLHKGDVSVVNWGANPNTSVGIRSAADAIKVLADCDESELAEIRADADVANLKVAQEKLTALRAGQVVDTEEAVNILTLNALEDGDVSEDGERLDHESQLAKRDEEEESADDAEEREPITINIAANEAMSSIFAEFAQRIAELEALVTGNKAEAMDERTEDGSVEEARSTRLDEALAAMGILPEKLSLAVALAFAD